MHRRIILIMAMVVQMFFAQAQMMVGLNKDSLKQVLSKLPSDSNRVQLLITLGQQYEDHNPDSALFYYQQAGDLSEKLNYPIGIIKYINNYTAVLNVQGKLEESIRLSLKAVDISKQHGLKRYEGKALGNIGAVYQYQENYQLAIEYYLKALPIVEQFADLQSQSLLLTNLSGAYRSINQSEKALEYAQQALAIGIRLNDSYSQAKALINMGNCFKDLSRFPEAEESLLKAKEIGIKTNDINTIETSLIDLGNIYLHLNQPDKYMPVFEEALPLTDSIQDVSGKAYALLGIGEGLYYRQQWPEAETQLQLAATFSKEHDQKEVLHKSYLALSDVMVATHRLNEAQIFRAKHDSIEVLLLNESMIKNVQDLEAKYKFEQQQNELLQKDLQLQKSEVESSNRQFWLIFSLLGVIVLLLILISFYLYYRQRQLLHKQTVKSMEADKNAVRLQSLIEGQQQERIRISQEIHDDMGSGLTSMLFLSRSLVSTVPSDKITISKLTNMATSLIEKMNEIIWAMRSEPEPLDDFIVYLRSMAGEVLGNAGIDFQFEVKSKVPSLILPPEYRHHIHLIAKEAIHNVVKHSQATTAKLSLDFQSPSWKIEIQDNGVGFTDDVTNGNGMKNMQRRATALRGHITVRHKHGTDVKLEVPAIL